MHEMIHELMIHQIQTDYIWHSHFKEHANRDIQQYHSKTKVHRHANQTNADSFKEPQHDMHLKNNKGSVSVNQIISQF